MDFKYIRGLEHAKRALEVAAMGTHSLILIGPPGEGKTMLINEGRKLSPVMNGWNLRESWPCPCGYYMSALHACTCDEEKIRFWYEAMKPWNYDMQLWIENDYDRLFSDREGESTERVLARLDRVRQFADDCGYPAYWSEETLFTLGKMEPSATSLFQAATKKLHLSPRQYFNTWRVARSIATLAESETIRIEHIAEAIQYRGQEGTWGPRR